MEVFEAIKTRRSVREFTDAEIDKESLLEVIEAGVWAPSGLNNQPWKVVIVSDPEKKNKLAGLTKYSRIINSAKVCLAIFYDKEEGYNETKDILAIGAFIQNTLLAIHNRGLGACWLGEILKQDKAVEELLSVPASCRLMAVIALGVPQARPRASSRRPISEIILK